jgi:hypothetical protein
MIKLDSNPLASTFSPVPSLVVSTSLNTSLERARRLIVLIPNAESDYAQILPRVWELAHALECHVLFLSLYRDVSEEPKLRRALVTISALIQDGWISAEAKTEVGNNWLKVVKSNWRDEDVIVCFAEQRTGLMQRPLGQILESKLNATVYLLSGPEQFNRHNINWLVQLTAWAGFIAIIAGLFVLQVNIDRSLTGGVQTVMLVITVLFEFWLIWVWNNLFS